jgi:hypothetical protein
MRKLLLLACFVIIASAGAYAQTITYGVKAGLNLTELPASGDGLMINNKYLTGFHVGGVVDFKFDSFSIQPALLFTTKGGKTDFSFSESFDGQTISGTGTAKTTLNYLELPVNFLYRVPAGDGNVFFGGGPYIALGLSGKAKATATAEGQTTDTSEDVKFGSADGEIKNPDFGFNALIGYQLNSGFTINAGYGQSFVSSTDSEGKVKNQGFSFSVGYFFK